MASPPRKIAFIMASTRHGAMIVNRFDYKENAPGDGFGVGYMLLNNSGYDLDDVVTGITLLDARRKHFGDGVRVLDIGANIGVFTVEWARHMDGWGEIEAFEAQERVFLALAGNIAINNCFNARPLCAAVARQPGSMRVPVPNYQESGSFGSLELRQSERNEDIGQAVDYAPERMTSVATISIDSLRLPRLDLMKVDVEGMEMEVLEGARHTIGEHHPILIVEHVKTDEAALNFYLDGFGYVHFLRGMNTVAIHRDDPTTLLGSG